MRHDFSRIRFPCVLSSLIRGSRLARSRIRNQKYANIRIRPLLSLLSSLGAPAPATGHPHPLSIPHYAQPSQPGGRKSKSPEYPIRNTLSTSFSQKQGGRELKNVMRCPTGKELSNVGEKKK